MINQHPYRPTITPVPEGISRPLWSVMIPTYNCAKYLRETLASVLAQDPGAEVMQIMVVDDHSTQDDPEAVIKEMGQGRVEFYRQPQNVGAPRNFQTCLEFSRGYLIHQLHGDDYVKPGFYQKMEQAFTTAAAIGAAFCRNLFVDEWGQVERVSCLEMTESGVLPNPEWLEKIAMGQLIQTPSIVVRREVYETLGGFDYRLAGTEDWEMWVRISAQYPIWYEVEPLAIYRMHSKSLSRSTVTSGFFVQQLYKAAQINQSYLPVTIQHKVLKQTQQNCAYFALGTADKLLNEGDWKRAIAQLQAALKYSLSYRVVRSAGRILLLDGSHYLWNTALAHLIGNKKHLPDRNTQIER
jgi:GT2 family glycosyltransferase